ncbi:MAG: helix-turn-helix transcriptional regulator, partial [Bacillota bacterium]|nr:helix-turn-helix transcriptional regulator [Bacillota bacterium]
MYKQVWSGNVRRLLAENKLSLSEAAKLIGTSKQYLSSILAETEAQSTKEDIMHRLCILLHSNPGRLYALHALDSSSSVQLESQAIMHAQQATSAADLAILAERHFLAQDYMGCHEVVRKLLNEYAFELSPAATAQALLLAGKCCCLQGQVVQARAFLKEALSLFQKRLTAQPDKYLTVCMDTYRYLGLAEYFDEQYNQAIKAYLRIFALAERYPELAIELVGKVDNAGTCMLRCAVKLGKISCLESVVTDINKMAAHLELSRLQCRAQLDEAFCTYLIRSISEPSSPEPTLDFAACSAYITDPFAALQYGLMLWDSGRAYELAEFSAQVELASEGELAFVGAWLSTLLSLTDYAETAASLSRLEKMLDSHWAALYKGIFLALKAAWLNLTGEKVGSFYLWQEALYILRSNRETPYYLYCFNWFMRISGPTLAKEDHRVFGATLD